MGTNNGHFTDGYKEARQAEKRRRCLELREAGYSYEEIAQEMGWSHRSPAQRYVQRALKATYQEPADAVRQLELRRLDRLAKGIWQQATGKPASGETPAEPPSLFAIDRLMKLMDRRARLLGLDAPIKTDSKVAVESLSPMFNIVDNARNGTPHTNGEPVQAT